jgi:hypothetical protein
MSLVIRDKANGQMSEGLHRVTVTKVEDLGLQATRFGAKDMAAIYFTADDGTIARLRLVKSLHPKSNLGRLLGALGIPFGETFDLTTLVGVKCEAVIQHKETDGKIEANIAAVLRVRKGQKLSPNSHRRTQKDRVRA